MVRPHNPNPLVEWNDVAVGSGGPTGPVKVTWMEYTLLDSIVNGGNTSSLDDSFGYISSLSYALLAQAWRTELAQGVTDGRNLSQTWVPQNVTLNGTQPRVYARLEIGGVKLIIIVVSTVVLAIVSYASMQGHADDHVDPIIRDGGVIDLLSLVAGFEATSNHCRWR